MDADRLRVTGSEWFREGRYPVVVFECDYVTELPLATRREQLRFLALCTQDALCRMGEADGLTR